MSNSLPALVAGHNRLGFNVFTAAKGAAGDKNVVFSPTSLLFALGMTWNGSAEITREEQARVLGLSGMGPEEANDGFSALRRKLVEETPGVEIAEANSLWVARSLSLQPAFQELCRRVFGAEVESVDFSDPATSQAIIGWGLEKTRGKVDLKPFSAGPLTTLVLINAIFFQGLWTEPFDLELTQEKRFTLPDGTWKKVPMMSRTGELEAIEDEDFQAVRLPYGKERRFVFEAYLPARKKTLPDLLAHLTADRWECLASAFEPVHRGTLDLPRFAFSWMVDLIEPLKKLGMKAAFGSEADFTPMMPGSSAITQAFQKARIELDEKGTTAAAVTVIALSRSLPAFQMSLDRPFFWAIRDLDTGAALFLGVVADPTAG